jgi:hypothetical protein
MFVHTPGMNMYQPHQSQTNMKMYYLYTYTLKICWLVSIQNNISTILHVHPDSKREHYRSQIVGTCTIL